MFYPLRNFLGSRAILILVIVQFSIVLGLFILNAIFIQPQDSLLLLHYSVDYGVDFAGPWQYVYRLPLLGFFIFLVNTFLAYLLFYIERLYTHTLLAVGLLVNSILAVVVVLVILLNI